MISMYAYTKYIIEETPTAFGTAIGTGAVDGDWFFDAPGVAVGFSGALPLWTSGLTGKCAPRSKAFHKHGNPK